MRTENRDFENILQIFEITDLVNIGLIYTGAYVVMKHTCPLYKNPNYLKTNFNPLNLHAFCLKI